MVGPFLYQTQMSCFQMFPEFECPLFRFCLYHYRCVFASFPLRYISNNVPPISNQSFTMKNHVTSCLGTVDGIHLHRDPERQQDEGRLRVEQLTLQEWDSNQLSLIDEVLIRFKAFTIPFTFRNLGFNDLCHRFLQYSILNQP